MKRPLLSTDPDGAVLRGQSPVAEWDGERFTKKRRGNPEAAIQRAIKQRLAFAGIVCVSVPNEARRSAIAGRAMKATGMMPGFPDLIALQAPGRVCFLEVKAPAGRVSPHQAECHAMLTRMGITVRVVRSIEDAEAAVKAAGFRV